MFEFGRDLRRLFEKARDSHDLGWLELVSVNLVETEARHQSTDAGRVSCARPFEAWMRAAALWREHARRTGQPESLSRAEQAGRDAAKFASVDDQAMQAALDVGQTSLLAFDLYGAPRRLNALLDSLKRLPPARRAETGTEVKVLIARIHARQARLNTDHSQIVEAADELSQAMSALHEESPANTDELKLELASLALEAGLLSRNARLLDRAGRDLRHCVERSQPDERPLSRARALALCGTGMAALASFANDSEARSQAHALFNASADQFTPEHSPLDWAAIQLLRAERGPISEKLLNDACRITDKPGLILGAILRERNVAHKIDRTEADNDDTGLWALRHEFAMRLSRPTDETLSIDWACDQIAMARISMALEPHLKQIQPELRMALYEAADVASYSGAPALASRARDLMNNFQPSKGNEAL